MQLDKVELNRLPQRDVPGYMSQPSVVAQFGTGWANMVDVTVQ